MTSPDSNSGCGDGCTRREVLTGAVALPSVPAVLGFDMNNLSLSVPSGATPLVEAGQQYVTWDVPTDQVVHRHGLPSWIVETDGDRIESLQQWQDGSDDRYVIREASHQEWDAALIAADEGDAHDLLENSWVETLDLDIEIKAPEPVTPAVRGELGLASVSRTESFWLSGGINPLATSLTPSQISNGLAFKGDMPDASIDDVREYTSDVATTSSGTAVVVDTGVAAGGTFEDDLADTRILDGSKDFTDPSRPTVGESGLATIDDKNGHGSWVASAMAGDGATYTGYAPNASILVIKVLDDSGKGSSFDIADGVRYATDQAGLNAVACLSLGSPAYSHVLDQAVAYAAGGGLPCCVAAGNSRESTRWVGSPADSLDAITVTAVTAEPPTDARSASFSQHDPDSGNRDLSGGATSGYHVDVTAPGCKIIVDTPDGQSRLTGTSMAAPCAGGGILQLLSEETGLRGDVDAIRDRLKTTAAPVPHAATTEAGAGMIDISAAVNDTEPEQTQGDAMDRHAESRKLAHERLSDIEGRWFH